MTKTKEQAYFPMLDALRGYLTLIIFFMHIHESFIPNSLLWFHSQLELARMTVIWFFVVSGFLITRILLRTDLSVSALKMFWIRRSLRIFPVFYLMVLVVFFLQRDEALFWSALYLSNYATDIKGLVHPLQHVWSLCVEEHFYLLWPGFLLLFPKHPTRLALLFLLLSLAYAFFTIYLFPKDLAKDFFKHASHIHFVGIASGCLIATLPIEFHKRFWGWLGASLLIVCVSCALIKINPFSGVYNALIRTLLLQLGAVGLFLLVQYLSLSASSKIRTILEWAPMLRFGKMTYGFYLIHYVVLYSFGVLHTASMHNEGNWPILGLAVVLCFALTLLSYYWIERPLHNLKDRFRY